MGEVQQVCNELLSHFSRILDPCCSSEERSQSEKIVSDFRDESPFAVPCGMQLAEDSNPIASKFGLDILEHFIRFKWNTLDHEAQVNLHRKLLELSSNIFEQQMLYVKEAIAKCIVEIVKKVWPQFWPTFIQELHGIGSQPAHMELILLVYRRLIEDVTGFDNQLSSKRKSDLISEIKTEGFLTPLFSLLTSVFESNLQSGSSCNLVNVAISTVVSLIDSVDVQYLTMNDGALLRLIFSLVSAPLNSEIQLQACDCLIDLVSKKGDMKLTADHRKLFLLFISKDILQWIHSIVRTHQASQSDNEDEYLLVKRLCELMVKVGTCQIIPMVSAEVLSFPDNLFDYLSLMLALTEHHSQLIVYNCLELWSALLNSQSFRTCEVLILVLPQLIQVLRTKQLKVGDPEAHNHPSCVYSAIDFNGSIEHGIFFSKFKGTVNPSITTAVSLVPIKASEQALALVQELVQKPYQTAETCNEGSRNSPAYLEWEGVISYIECWVSGLKQGSLQVPQVASIGVSIVDILLSFNPVDVTVALCSIKMLEGGLQSFIAFENSLLQRYLEKILFYVVYPGEQVDKTSLSREQKQVRVTSLYCLTNLVKGYTAEILPATDQLLDYYMKLVASDRLLYSEKGLFIETFTTLSHFKGLEEQAAMLSRLMEEVIVLIGSEMRGVISSFPNFIQYLGLDKDVSDPVFTQGDKGLAHQNRGKLCYCVHVLMGVLQRCTLRERRHCNAPNKTEFIPSLVPLIMPLVLEFVFPLIKIFHILWSEESKPFLSKSFQAVHSLSQYEKEVILGTMGTSPLPQDNLGRVIAQLIVAYDHCVMSVGFACSAFGLSALSEVGYVESIIQCVFDQLSSTSQLRLKPIIRNIMNPIVLLCPGEHWLTMLAPLLAHFCHITFQALQSNWSSMIDKGSSTDDTSHITKQDSEEHGLSEEVIHHQFTVYLTRQYAQLLETVCLKKQSTNGAPSRTDNNASGSSSNSGNRPLSPFEQGGGGPAVDGMETAGEQTNATAKGVQLSDLAEFLLRNRDMQRIILLSIVAPLAWADGYTTKKCINITTAAFEKISVNEFGEEVISQIMDQIFLALQVHREDDGIILQLVILALLIYELALVSYPSLSVKISSLPGCNREKVEKFNQKLASGNISSALKISKVTKQKREEFKRLLSGVIAKPVGQLHKKTPVFLDLPSLVVKKGHRFRKKEQPVGTEDISSLFEPSDK